jgi:hypothetical protein
VGVGVGEREKERERGTEDRLNLCVIEREREMIKK